MSPYERTVSIRVARRAPFSRIYTYSCCSSLLRVSSKIVTNDHRTYSSDMGTSCGGSTRTDRLLSMVTSPSSKLLASFNATRRARADDTPLFFIAHRLGNFMLTTRFRAIPCQRRRTTERGIHVRHTCVRFMHMFVVAFFGILSRGPYPDEPCRAQSGATYDSMASLSSSASMSTSLRRRVNYDHEHG